ncbi:hypothetical protein DPMN_051394 [Dreissena polymorpha]|uniref:Uncharacterized protein n=1 Tax=Dreissena polymorpha TaxID=45954 RepID=A0A9D4CJ13_DREPO|nr:hypothetical protein DPMN_051394 [Dreissena polymorpha]
MSYHLSQATWREIHELGMVDVYKTNDEFRHFYGMLDVLAFLPVAVPVTSSGRACVPDNCVHARGRGHSGLL